MATLPWIPPTLTQINLAQMVAVAHDQVMISWDGDDIIQIVYKQGGGVVATLSFTYNGDGRLIGVVKT